MKTSPRVLGFFTCLVLTSVFAPLAGSPPTDAAHYFRTEGFMLPSLSPGGTHLFTRMTKANGHDALMFMDLGNGEVRPFGVGETEHAGDVRWLDDDNLFLAFRDTAGSDSFAMFHLDRATLRLTTVGNYFTRIVGVPAARPTNVWVYYPDGRNHLLEIDGLGKTRTSAPDKDRNLIRSIQTPRDAKWFLRQADGEARFVVTQRTDKDKPVLHWLSDPASDKWHQVPYDWHDKEVLGVDASAKGVFLALYEEHQTKGLYRLDAATGTLSEPLFRDPDFSLDGANALYSRRSASIKGLRYRTDHKVTVWLDRNFQGLQAYLDKQLPNSRNYIVDWNLEESVFLVNAERDQEPDRLLLLDLRTQRLTDLTGRAPWNPEPVYFRTEPVPFTSRDGHAMRAYLTRPAEAHGKKNPLVVIFDRVEGRDSADYDPMAQWLAANGNAVLRVNPRNAQGQAKALSEDLRYDLLGGGLDHIDAVRAVLSDPSIDGSRIGLVAEHLGCYQALIALADAPDQFRAAVFYKPVVRTDRFLEDSIKRYLPLDHAIITAHLSSSPEHSRRYSQLPDNDALGRIQARINFLVERVAPPGRERDFQFVEERYEEDAVYLQRSLRRAGRDSQIVRLPLRSLKVDAVPPTKTELGRLLFEAL